MDPSSNSSVPNTISPGVSLEELGDLLHEASLHVPSLVEQALSSPVPNSLVEHSPLLSASPDSAVSDGHENTEIQNDSTPASDNLTKPLQFHSPQMPFALKALLGGKIQVVEYGSQVQYRCGYAEVLILVEWAVPDDQLSLASQILIDNGFPLMKYHEGEERDLFWKSPCLAHDLDGAGWSRVHLLPLSLVDLTLDETTEVPSTFAYDMSLLSPKPPRYFLSLIRHLLKLPIGNSGRWRLEKDIYSFISAYILHDPPAHTPRWVLAQQTEESYQEQVEKGVQEMKEWDWGDIEERYLKIAELVVRNCQYVSTLTDVTDNEPSSPIREYDSDASGW
ncbi:hypothetical protein N7528_008376 [Penicillium herquei]|nr:hypothetical protein N7528_008376 [Penicillium herquei]